MLPKFYELLICIRPKKRKITFSIEMLPSNNKKILLAKKHGKNKAKKLKMHVILFHNFFLVDLGIDIVSQNRKLITLSLK